MVSGDTWPNLLVVGAMKAGTTSLWRYLDQHPDIFMSPMKEPHFFSRAESEVPGAVIREEGKYLDLFREGRAAPLRGEASTSYLWDETTPARIAAAIPNPRIIILLRDPVQRAYSHYLMDYRYGHQSLGFYEALVRDQAVSPRQWAPGCHLYVDLGLYGRQLRRYLETLGREHVLVLLTHDLEKSPGVVLERLGGFLGVDPAGFGDPAAVTPQNPFAAPRGRLSRTLMRSHLVREQLRRALPAWVRALGRRTLYQDRPKPELPPESVRYLAGIYEQEVTEVEQLLGRRLAPLRQSWRP